MQVAVERRVQDLVSEASDDIEPGLVGDPKVVDGPAPRLTQKARQNEDEPAIGREGGVDGLIRPPDRRKVGRDKR